jgi:hypothetical protein
MLQNESESKHKGRSHLFKKGQSGNINGKPKGAVSLKTRGWQLLSETITTELTDKFMQEMSKLDGQQYINAYLNVLEFFRPRLSRVESKVENTNVEQVVINIPVSTDIPQFPDNFDEAEVIE